MTGGRVLIERGHKHNVMKRVVGTFHIMLVLVVPQLNTFVKTIELCTSIGEFYGM